MKNGLPAAHPDTPSAGGVVAGARASLILLVCINIFNFMDRQILAAVEPEIRHDYLQEPAKIAGLVGLAATPTDAAPLLPAMWLYQGGTEYQWAMTWRGTGSLFTAFLVTYMLLAPIFGWLANRMSRWVLIGIGVILWSFASGGSGLAWGFLMLLITRCLVGVGEAIYGPVAPAVIADLYPVSRRGQILSLFYAAIPFGGALGYALGSLVVTYIGDWRWAFYLVVPPGILLGVWCFFMKEPPRGQTDGVADQAKGRKLTGADYLVLLKTPSYVLNCLGMTAMSFAIGGLAAWTPAYLKELSVDNLFGIIPPTLAFGALTALSGLVATLVGGWAGDWLKPRFPGSYFLVSGVALVLAAPMLILFVYLPFPLAWIPLVLSVFLLFFNTGPTNAILANVTHPLLRPTAFAINILVIHLFGDAISPPIMGEIAAWTYPRSLRPAFLFVSVLALLGGVLWLWGTHFLQRDTRLAPKRLGGFIEEKHAV